MVDSKDDGKIRRMQDLMRIIKRGDRLETDDRVLKDLYQSIKNGPDEHGRFYPHGVGVFKDVKITFLGPGLNEVAKAPHNLTCRSLYHEDNGTGEKAPVIELRKKFTDYSGRKKTKFAHLKIKDGQVDIGGEFTLKDLKE